MDNITNFLTRLIPLMLLSLAIAIVLSLPLACIVMEAYNKCCACFHLLPMNYWQAFCFCLLVILLKNMGVKLNEKDK